MPRSRLIAVIARGPVFGDFPRRNRSGRDVPQPRRIGLARRAGVNEKERTLRRMSNLNDPLELTADGIRAVRVGEGAGAEHLGASMYELQPGEEMVFHYHVQREELLIVLHGRLSLRSADGWEELPEGEVVAFPRGERGAHAYRNDRDEPVRLLMISEMNAPNISVYPDTNQIGLFDAGQRASGTPRATEWSFPSATWRPAPAVRSKSRQAMRSTPSTIPSPMRPDANTLTA
jgi:uncharacterized cupin superfamily protein